MLYIVATPIGNRDDITLRALSILKSVDYVLAEDTRKTGLLLSYYNIKKPLLSFFDHNEKRKIPDVIADLTAGKNIALVSNAGTPCISDPGYALVRECRKQNLAVTASPGASSVITAISLSSLPHDQFLFLGYLPRKASGRRKLLQTFKRLETTLVFFESPYRLTAALEDALSILGNKRIALCRELTKKFEEVIEGTIEEARGRFKLKKPQGEFVVMIDNRTEKRSQRPFVQVL